MCARRHALRLATILLIGSATGCGRRAAEAPAATPRGATSPPPPASAAAEAPRQAAAPGEPMTARLAAIAASVDPRTNPFVSPRVVEALRAAIASAPDDRSRADLRLQLAQHLVNASRTDEARRELALLLDLPPPQLAALGPDVEARALDILALSWLRQGELDNCVSRHGVDSCKLPIRGDGLHVNTSGSREAQAVYRRILERRPDDLSARWLLNIASQTLGEWPEGVDPRWRIPPETFAPEADVGRFLDVANAAGLSASGLSGGAILEDFDGDGLLDVMTSSWGLSDPLRLFVSRGDGTFVERSEEAGLEGLTGGLNIVHADYDDDGDADVFVARGAWLRRGGHIPNSLLRNDGGRFTDVTEAAGLLTFHPTQAVAWGDYDGDGRLDLFVGNESTEGDPHVSELWHGEEDGTFTPATGSLPARDLGFVKGAAWGDCDNDGFPDLAVSTLGSDNLLFHNDGRAAPAGGWSFTEVGAKAGVTRPVFSFPTWFFDYDNDGWLDLFDGGFLQGSPGDTAALYLGLPQRAAVPRLYRNRHDGTFEDVTVAAGLARVAVIMGSNWGDVDEDGWQDMYLGTGDPDLRTIVPNRLFRNDRGRAFQDATTSAGMGHLQKGHGVAFGDIDGDGDLDVYEDMGGAVTGDVAFNALYENPGHGRRHLTLRLVGTSSNRCAIGARIRVAVRTPSGPRDVHLLAGTGGSFGGSSLQQEIGLGDATAIDAVEIRWPGFATEAFTGAELDGSYEAVEGAGRLAPRPLKRFRLPHPAVSGG